MFYVITLPLLSLFPMTAKENRAKHLFFPPRRKFLSTVGEVSFHRGGKKNLRGGKNKYWHANVLNLRSENNRNA